jgi:CP family cyanate transporter-like MFS transporter
VRRAGLLAGLFLAALSLRPQLVGVGPLIPAIQSDLGISHAVAGLLGTIPILCMGLFAPPAPFVSGRLGSRLALAASLALIGVAGLARGVVPGAALLIVLTFPVGIGMGVAGALLPVWVKERFADRPAFSTGVYATAISAGAAISSASAVPLADVLGGWRAPLLLFSGVTLGLAALWLWVTRDEPRHVRTRERPLRLPLRSALAWRLVASFFLVSSIFYGLSNWLPDAYTERGWSESSAGALVAVVTGVSIPCAFAVGWLADRVGSRRAWLCGTASLQLAGVLGVVLVPSGGFGWAVVLGAAMGPLFPLTLTLPLDVGRRPEEVAAFAGMMLGVGYTLSSFSPLVLGAVRDATGSFSTALWTLVGLAAALVILDASFTRELLGGARPSGERPLEAVSS